MKVSASAFPLLRLTITLVQPFWITLVFATLTGIVSGFATTRLLAEINHSLQIQQLDNAFWLSFSLLLIISTAGAALAGSINSRLGQRMIATLRKELAARILQAPIDAIEQFRAHRILAVLNNDIDTVSAFTFSFAGYVINFSIALAGVIYLLWLSPLIFILALLFLFGGMLLTARSRRNWITDYEGVRHAQDNLQKQYQAIINGAKELRLHRPCRSTVYRRKLSVEVDRIAQLKTHAMQQMWRVEGAASALFFIAIALMLAGKPWLQSSNVIIGAAVIILLYIKSPFEQLAGAFAVADQARIALRRLAELADSFSTPEPDILLSGMPNQRPCVLQCLELRELSWYYADQNRFSLGPLNLKLYPGQITFVTGDNGSGKTTLIKILLGLYEPQNGTILLNGKPVERAQLDDYRQLFSTVFTDYYLFEEISQDVSPEQLMPLLEKLQLNHKVTFEDHRFTTTDLSTGQRKRLALLHAWLDDRPVIIFDEWAADQDPEFRQRFYQQFLPELKAKNKLVVVISHDDRYFSMADQLITLRNGQLVSTQ